VFTRLRAVIAKEFLHIRRDKRTLGIMFLMPVVQMVLLGYVATTNIEHLRTAVLNRDRVLPSIFLSGFFFPIEAMPAALQATSYVIPLRYFLIIVRSIVLKGVGADVLLGEIVALCIFGALMLGLASTRFRKKLE